MTDTPNPKCTCCKCYWIPDETDIKTSGLYFKSCKKCRNNDKVRKDKKKCEHNKKKSNCVDCGGVSICSHNKQKSTCRDCGGSSFCIHNKRKQNCIDCKGGSICSHNKIKSICRDCGGSSFCIHNKRKTECVDCVGSAICIHNKRKSTCIDCGGSQICIHNKRKSRCVDCGGSQICSHNRQKSRCKDCNFYLYLIHLQRNQIRRCFNNSKLDKSKHSIEYLGCDIETFLNHIEKKITYYNTYLFTDKVMTWDNIHIDHIKPVSRFNLDDEDEFLDCCHYTNLQPLLTVDNLEKHNKWTGDNEKYWTENIKGNSEYTEIYM